jgi:hypothetical protein
MVGEVRSTGSANNNGTFFKTGATGTDFSQQDAPQYILTGLTSGGAGDTILSASAADDMVGNGLFSVAGTNQTIGTWFEIISVVAGVSITCSTSRSGASIAIGAIVGGSIRIGGANSTITDEMLECCLGGGFKIWVKGNITTTTISAGNDGAAGSYNFIEGYQTTRGDNPTGSNRPLISQGATAWLIGDYYSCKNLRHTGTGTASALIVSSGNYSTIENCEYINTSTSADRTAIICNGSTFIKCQFTSYRGRGTSGSYSLFFNCTFSGNSVGAINQSTNFNHFDSCIFFANVAHDIYIDTTTALRLIVKNCTFYGSEAKQGIGIELVVAAASAAFLNNIFSGKVTALSSTPSTTLAAYYSDFNNFYNNTTDRTNWPTGASDIALNPSFADVAQVTGDTATTSGTTLTQSGATFQTSGVAAGNFIRLHSGTGITAGIYRVASVTSETVLELDIAPGTSATADKVFTIWHKTDFRVGANMKAVGSPSTFPGASANCISYVDIGAVQRKEDYPVVGDVKTGTVYSNGELTGTQANISAGGITNNMGNRSLG